MNLENYFDFITANDIRIKGTRVGIETILLDYLDLGLFPEDIVLRYPVLTLEAVYATITYYWRNQAQIDVYLSEWKAHGERMRAAQALHPSPLVQHLREFAMNRPASLHGELQPNP